MKKTFTVDTPISKKYGALAGQVIGYARISATAEYRGGPYFDRDYCDLKITNVIAKVGTVESDLTLAYQISKQLSDALAEIIEDAAFAHCEYLYEQREEAQEVQDIEYTDVTQDAQYEVIAIAERKENVTIVSPLLKAS